MVFKFQRTPNSPMEETIPLEEVLTWKHVKIGWERIGFPLGYGDYIVFDKDDEVYAFTWDKVTDTWDLDFKIFDGLAKIIPNIDLPDYVKTYLVLL